MIALQILNKNERAGLKSSILSAARQLSIEEVRELADALHNIARVRCDLEKRNPSELISPMRRPIK